MLEYNFVLLDCDIGPDDAWALLMLIKAETVLKLFKILAITTVVGNTYVGNVTENGFRMLDSVNRTDIPIYKGCAEGILPLFEEPTYFGKDGFGDVLPEIPTSTEYIAEGHAVNRMYELASKYPKQISFVMTGPLSNLATCIVMHEDFLDKVKDIWILGGNLYESSNTSNYPEFNFRSDAGAAHIVLKHATKVPVYLVPLEPTVVANEGIDLEFRFDHLGSVDSPPINLLNVVEKEIYIPKGNWIANDAIMTSAFVFRENMIVKSQRYHGEVKPYGKHAGLMLLDHEEEHNVYIIEELNADNYKKIIGWTAGVQDIGIHISVVNIFSLHKLVMRTNIQSLNMP